MRSPTSGLLRGTAGLEYIGNLPILLDDQQRKRPPGRNGVHHRLFQKQFQNGEFHKTFMRITRLRASPRHGGSEVFRVVSKFTNFVTLIRRGGRPFGGGGVHHKQDTREPASHDI